jgi:hypothetical protein
MLFTDVSMAAETPKRSLEPRDVHRGVVPCRLNETGDPRTGTTIRVRRIRIYADENHFTLFAH